MKRISATTVSILITTLSILAAASEAASSSLKLRLETVLRVVEDSAVEGNEAQFGLQMLQFDGKETHRTPNSGRDSDSKPQSFPRNPRAWMPFSADLDVTATRAMLPVWSQHARRNLSAPSNSGSDDVFVLGHKDFILPDHTDKKTVLAMGLMAFNAYYDPEADKWLDVPGFEPKNGFGSTKSAIRGHIYRSVNSTQDIAVIVIKGTSLQTPFQGGATGANDKLNDNKMFSCCCGKAGWSWRAVDGCYCSNSAATQCQSQCVQDASDYPESYYRLATTIADAARHLYPYATFWVTGHSLGGSLASLVALTFDYPAFTFEAPGDLLFAKRIGLLPPSPPQFQKDAVIWSLNEDGEQMERKFTMQTQSSDKSSFRTHDGGDNENWDEYLETLPIYQFGNNGDPIYLGTCTASIYSSCWLGGYAMETKCHLGKECVYDLDKDGQTPPSAMLNAQLDNADSSLLSTIKKAATPEFVSRLAKENINNHGIQFVLDSLLQKWSYVPSCKVNSLNENCVDCEKWSWLP
ncbi:putative lipase atg15 [Chytriomyces hyalinus]|nr:putative lipase atg15 [Chytriomyces hyalinus]